MQRWQTGLQLLDPLRARLQARFRGNKVEVAGETNTVGIQIVHSAAALSPAIGSRVGDLWKHNVQGYFHPDKQL
jgi:hypothetical protein